MKKHILPILILFLGALSFYIYKHHLNEVKKIFASSPQISDQIIKKIPQKKFSMPEIPHLRNNPQEMAKELIKKDLPKIEDEKLKASHLRFINDLFSEVLLRKPQEGETEKWFNVLSQEASREGVYRALTLGTEYLDQEYERPLKPTNSDYQKFAQYFFFKYLKIEVSDEEIAKLSHFSVKKISVKKALELADYFASSDPENLYIWYAILSSELAEKFAIWKLPIRSAKNQKTHYLWAKKMPYDFIKSEIIIKIHKVYNSLI